jgi:hypothetical protein
MSERNEQSGEVDQEASRLYDRARPQRFGGCRNIPSNGNCSARFTEAGHHSETPDRPLGDRVLPLAYGMRDGDR